MQTEQKNNEIIEKLFKAGAHFGYARSRRHPSALPFIFGTKNRVEIFDLEKTADKLQLAKDFIQKLARDGKQVLFISGKSESKDSVRIAAEAAGLPYVSGRFIGGTLTNFSQTKKRVDKLEKLMDERERGELGRYTKKERLLIDRDIDRLTKNFGGIIGMKTVPSALFVVDPKRERNAVLEAARLNIPVIAIANSDCNMREIQYALPANDALRSSVQFFAEELSRAYQDVKKETPVSATSSAEVAA